jgi:hypothetical protein
MGQVLVAIHSSTVQDSALVPNPITVITSLTSLVYEASPGKYKCLLGLQAGVDGAHGAGLVAF